MTARVEFSKTSYGPTEPIGFQVVVEGEPTSVSRDVTVTGSVVLPAQSPQQVSGTTQVVEGSTFGPFTAPGYDVVQDPAEPSRFTATPTAG